MQDWPGLEPCFGMQGRHQRVWLAAACLMLTCRETLAVPPSFPSLQAGKCGCVVFQFQLSFTCTDANLVFMAQCRQRLRQDVRMAVELRNRGWITGRVGWGARPGQGLI